MIAFQQDMGACGQYRVGYPMRALRDRGHEVEVILTEPRMHLCNAQFAGCDVLIIQRYPDPGIIDLVDSIQTQWTPSGVLKRPRVLFEIDDLVWKQAPNRPSYKVYTSEMRAKIKETMRRSDAIIASTPELADECRKINPKVYVCPNSIDFGIRNWEQSPGRLPFLGDRIVIGWAGGDRPSEDARVIGWALRDVLKLLPEVCVMLAGGNDCLLGWMRELELPPSRVALCPPVCFDDYPLLIQNFDIGIAPIADNPFNRCKSALKLLEYGAWGIPYVASDVGPYRRFHQETYGVGGKLAMTKPEWFDMLRSLVMDGELRAMKGESGKACVREGYSLEKAAVHWENVLREVCGEGSSISGASGGDRGRDVHSLV